MRCTRHGERASTWRRPPEAVQWHSWLKLEVKAAVDSPCTARPPFVGRRSSDHGRVTEEGVQHGAHRGVCTLYSSNAGMADSPSSALGVLWRHLVSSLCRSSQSMDSLHLTATDGLCRCLHQAAQRIRTMHLASGGALRTCTHIATLAGLRSIMHTSNHRLLLTFA
jgi:hypothetical protein